MINKCLKKVLKFDDLHFESKSFEVLLTVDPGEDVKVEDTWNFFIVWTVRGGQEE